jgi:hypothetical protein
MVTNYEQRTANCELLNYAKQTQFPKQPNQYKSFYGKVL